MRQSQRVRSTQQSPSVFEESDVPLSSTGENCKNNVLVCEGYAAPQVWKGGTKRSEERKDLFLPTAETIGLTVLVRRLSSTTHHGLPTIVDGVETDMDCRFFKHFVCNTSRVLTLHDNRSIPFQDLLLPMAEQHKGLMHSLLALSGLHIVQVEPDPAIIERQHHHFTAAISILNTSVATVSALEDAQDVTVEDGTVASTIVLCLICNCGGSTKGEYRMHLDGTRQLLPKGRSKSADFQRFIYEFYMFHHVLNSLTTFDRRPLVAEGGRNGLFPDFIVRPSTQPGTGALVGVLDGLFELIKSITALRDIIRARRIARQTPCVRYEHLSQANELDVGIRNWDPGQPAGSPRWLVAQVWRQSTWIYLYRTVQKSKPSPKITPVVDEGITYLRQLHPGDSGQSIMLTPLFLLGCAAFADRQRPEIESAFDKVQTYRNFGNIKHARDIVRKLWTLMDAGDERSWDWEGIMMEMGLDLLVT